jgi:hypothetical protein
MAQVVSDLGKKLLALAILLVAAWVLLKMVIGLVMGLVWVIVAVLAVVAIVWALRVL